MEGEVGSRENSLVATVTNHMKDRGGLDQCVSGGHSEKYLGSRCVLSVDPASGFDERLDVGGCESRPEKGVMLVLK